MKPAARFGILCSLAASLALARPARAEQRGAGMVYDRTTFPYGERVNQPLTLPVSFVRFDLPVVVNLAKDRVGEPVTVPLVLDYGLTNDVQAGIFHAQGPCLGGTSSGCGKTYDDVGGRLLVGISRAPEAQLAVEVSLLAVSLDDPAYRSAATLWYKRSLGNLALTVDAGLSAFLNKRDAVLAREVAFASAEGAVQLGESLSVFGRIGVNRALDTAAGYGAHTNVPVTFGGELEPIRKLDVGVEVGFPNLLGQSGTADERELTLFVRLFV